MRVACSALALHPGSGWSARASLLLPRKADPHDYGLGTHFVPISGGSLLAATAT
jgi:hypothetical protein